MKIVKGCACKDYQRDMSKIIAPMLLQALRTAHVDQNGKIKEDQKLGYQGKPFKYCPWCSKKLRME